MAETISRCRDIIVCTLVRFKDGKLLWVPLKEYRSNPEAGSYEVRERINPPSSTKAPSTK